MKKSLALFTAVAVMAGITSFTPIVNNTQLSGNHLNVSAASSSTVKSGDFSYKLNSGKLYITAYTGGVNVVIPSKIDDIPVYGIDDKAFYKNEAIKTLVVENGVMTIGRAAFAGCTNLKSANLSDSVTTLADAAFKGCSNLNEVSLGNKTALIGVETIGEYTAKNYMDYGGAFQDCINLRTIEIPETVTRIGAYSFNGCLNLREVVISDAAATIFQSAFEDCGNLAQLNLGTSVQNIQNDAFANCTRLTNLTLTDSVKTIGDYAFYGCSTMRDFNTGGGVTSIGQAAFALCESLSKFTVGDGVLKIGEAAFKGDISLATVTLGKNVTTIGVDECSDYSAKNYTYYGGAFQDCIKLSSIIIPETVQTIGAYSFYGCTGLQTLKIKNAPAKIKDYAFYGNIKLANVDFGDELMTVGSYAFAACSALPAITIPDSASVVDTYAFYESALPYFNSGDGVVSINQAAFAKCEKLQNVVIGDNVTSIGQAAFKGDILLKNVVLGNSLNTIGEENIGYYSAENYAYYGGAFQGCTSLETIVFADYLNWVGAYTFYDCTKLSEVKINDYLIKIYPYAFGNCAALARIDIPEYSVNNIMANAFAGCGNLSVAVIPDTVSKIEDKAFTLSASPKLVIYGVEDSKAHEYALANGIPFNDIGGVSNKPIITAPIVTAPTTTTITTVTTSATTTPTTATTEPSGFTLPTFTTTLPIDENLRGDSNGDGEITLSDLVELIKYLTFQTATISPYADINDDGRINIVDLYYLKHIILNSFISGK